MKMEDNILYWAKVKPNAIIPTKTKGNAGYDIYPCFEEEYVLLEPNETKLIPTGIASAVSEDYYLQVQERGSTGKLGIKYGAGVIDSNYRGEWFLAVTNANSIPLLITKNCNLIIIKDESGMQVVDKDNYKKSTRVYIKDCVKYPYEKALFQAVIHKIPNLTEKEISYEELQQIPSTRGTGKLGSSNK